LVILILGSGLNSLLISIIFSGLTTLSKTGSTNRFAALKVTVCAKELKLNVIKEMESKRILFIII
jgi:hypothetical protein